MPRRDKATYLSDMLKACTELEALYIDAGSLSTFLASNYFYRTAERCFQIIGEALYHINNLDRNVAISDKSRIIRLRHMLTHDYELIEHDRLWLFIEDNLPQLKTEVTDLLQHL